MDTTQTDPIQVLGDLFRADILNAIRQLRRFHPGQFDDKSNNAMIISVLGAAFGAKDQSHTFGAFIAAYGFLEGHSSGDAEVAVSAHIESLARLILMEPSDAQAIATARVVSELVDCLQSKGVPVVTATRQVSTSRPEAN